MINQNGSLRSRDDVKLSVDNRAFKYGDGIFDTIKFKDGIEVTDVNEVAA